MASRLSKIGFAAGSAGLPLAKLELQNGEILKAKLVIGADGARSQVQMPTASLLILQALLKVN